MGVVNLNGKIVPPEQAMVNVYDHGLLYGDGVFEGIRIYSGKVFRLRKHIERLYESALHVMLDIPWDAAKMTAETERTVRESGLKDGYIRLVVTRGVGSLGLDPAKCSHPQVIIIVDTI
ncbi:MAG: aminotransferase class IV, partial [Gemmataceae bacterium]|nr:aminotransferase class IV [Gemmataceae bacterium]